MSATGEKFKKERKKNNNNKQELSCKGDECPQKRFREYCRMIL
jgi:hypothetical protein